MTTNFPEPTNTLVAREASAWHTSLQSPDRMSLGPDEPLRMRVRRPSADVVVVEAGGALDAAAEPRFAEILRHRLSCLAATIVVDLSAVTFLNSTAATTLLESAQRARTREESLVLVSSPAVDRLLHLLEVSDRFCYVADADAAATSHEPTEPTAPAQHEEDRLAHA